MEAHVQARERLHAVALHLLAVAPELVGADELAKLRAPVAQIVDGDRLVAQKVKDAAQALPDHGGAQVADVEALGNVDGAEIQADGLAPALFARAPAAAGGEHALQRAAGEILPVQEKVEVPSHLFGLAQVARVDGFGQLGGDLRRAHAKHAAELEAGESVVAHLLLRRNLQKARDVSRGGQVFRLWEARCDSLCDQLRKTLLGIHAFVFLSDQSRVRMVPMGSPERTLSTLSGGSRPKTRTTGTAFSRSMMKAAASITRRSRSAASA